MVKWALTLFILTLNLSRQALATDDSHAHCETLLAESAALLESEEGIMYLLDESEIIPVQEVQELDFLADLVMPKGLVENEANFQSLRQKYLTELKPTLDRIISWMDTMGVEISFYQKLYRMGIRYDETKSAVEKRAILVAMLKLFGIKHENDFLKLIAEAKISMELKTALSRGIEKLIIKDPSWLAPLYSHMAAGGVPLK